MAEEEARLRDQGGIRDLHDLAELEDGWRPCYTFSIDYRHAGAIWKARPADGGTPITAGSAAALRAKLRQAAPVDRGSR